MEEYNMNVNLLAAFVRSASFEIENEYAYSSGEKYSVFIDGRHVSDTDTNVFSVYDLEPDTEYTLELKSEDESNVLDTVTFSTEPETVLLDVKLFGASGDGVTNDTAALQAAVACCPEGGTVRFRKGTYLTAPIFLKSGITVLLEEGAKLLGLSDRRAYPVLPGMTRFTGSSTEELNLASWEGNPLDAFAALITGIQCENVNIIGKGVIDGNAENGDWWQDVKKKRVAWRPRTVFFNHCRNITVQGVKIQNSPSWTVHPYYTDGVKLIDIDIYNPDDSPNTDGIDPESCTDVQILGVRISVGDDCIAIKSGKIYMGKFHTKRTEGVTIRNCRFERGHGSVTIGSEVACGITDVHVTKCCFIGTDRGLRIKTRRGRGERAVIDKLSFEHIKMDGVLMPFTVNMFYFCDPDGHSDYVQSQEALPVDERTPYIGSISIKDIDATGVSAVFACIYGLPERPVGEITIEDVRASYLPAEEREDLCPIMMDNFMTMNGRSVYIKNADYIKIKDVVLSGSADSEAELINVSRSDLSGLVLKA